MTRYARTKQFRKEILEQYCLYLIEEYKKNNINEKDIQELVYDNFEYLYENVEMIEKLEKLGLIEWNEISIHDNLKIEWIDKYSNKSWTWHAISWNKNLELSWLEKYPKKEWNWHNIAVNKNLQIEWIDKYPNKLCWNGLSMNQNLKIEWIDKYPYFEWSWNYITYNPNFNIEWMEKYPTKDWGLE
mgnify:CR=1 FL=1